MHDVSRHQREEVFHDNLYRGDADSPLHYKYNPTYSIFKRLKELIGLVRGKRILEYGCGDGWITAELCAMGAIVDAFDISEESISATGRFLKRKGLEKNCTLKKMNAEKLEYTSNSFDVVVGFAILHHLDLSKAIGSLFRVLRSGGVAYFAEPICHNPFLKLYRSLTPKYRTVDEHPLSILEIEGIIKHFRAGAHEEHYLTALLTLMLVYITHSRELYNKANKFLTKYDRKILGKYPQLGKWAWYSIIELRK